MRNKLIRKCAGIAAILLMLAGCNTLDPVPTNNFTDATFWQSQTNAELVVNMAYNQLHSAAKLWDDEALSDNVFEGRSNTAQRSIRNGLADPTLGVFANEWRTAYEGIKTCHVFLDFVDLVPNMDEALKLRRKAEIRFIRAFLFFRLVNFFGDVPFFTTDITLEQANSIKRTTKAEILVFIHRELDEIMDVLPSRNGLPTADNGRITRGAACAFQARAYLYESNWTKVVEYTDMLINQQSTFGNYGLFNDYAGLFTAVNEYNQEVILDYGYVPSLKMWDKLYDAAPLSAGARLNAYAPLQGLVDNYLTLAGKATVDDASYDEDNPYVDRDPRLAATLVYHGATWQHFNGSASTVYIRPGTGSNSTERMDNYSGPSANASSTGYYVKKYYDQTATVTFQSGLNIILFRYADILLMYAEAKMELGEMDEAVWNATIRKIRERAGFEAGEALDFPASLGASALRPLIRNERRSELALEGLRYYDIVRWKAGSEYLNGYVYGAKFANNGAAYIRLDERRFDESRDYLWSLPRAQMDLNPNLLPNNPGFAN